MKGQWGIQDFHVAIGSGSSNFNLPSSNNTCAPIPDPRSEAVVLEDAIAARKVQKADREKLRRDRLNEYFLELGRTTDPDRPKSDKVTVLSETIQLLKDLTAEVDQLKAECATHSEESNELQQEKKELQEEKQSLQADVNSLNLQMENQQRSSFPWGCVEPPPPVVMTPAFSYPFPLSVPPTPYPFFGNQGLGLLPTPYPAYIPYRPPPPAPSAPALPPHPEEPGGTVRLGRKRSGERSSCGEPGGVVTELELKTPGCSDRRTGGLVSGDVGGEGGVKRRTTESSSSSGSRVSSQVLEDSSCSTVSE